MRRFWSWFGFHFKRAFRLEHGWRGMFKYQPEEFKTILLRNWSFFCVGMAINLFFFGLILLVILFGVGIQAISP